MSNQDLSNAVDSLTKAIEEQDDRRLRTAKDLVVEVAMERAAADNQPHGEAA